MLLLSLFKISGHSMESTIHQGQMVLASSIPYFFSKPKIGDIVVVKYSKRRHSGLSRISLSALGFAERFWSRFARCQTVPGFAPQNDEENKKYFIKRINKINRKKYFVRGDNEKDSLDSRRFGWISKKDIVGKVILKMSEI